MQPPHAKTLSETCECPFQFKSELFFSKIDGRCWKIPHLSSFEARICDVPFGADTAAYPDHLASGPLRANLGHLGTCPECAMSVGFSRKGLKGLSFNNFHNCHTTWRQSCGWCMAGSCTSTERLQLRHRPERWWLFGQNHIGAPSMWTSLFNVIWISSRVTPLLLDFP